MKRMLSLFLTLALILAFVPSTNAFAMSGTEISASIAMFENQAAEHVSLTITKEATDTDMGEVYIGNGTNALLLNNKSSKLILPKTIIIDTKEYKVVGINDNAFKGFSEIEEIVFNENILYIENNAFDGNTNLTTITGLSDNATLGNGAFARCDNLTSFTLPSNLTIVSDSLFSYSNIESIIIPASVTEIGINVFAQNENLTSVTFEADSQLKSIGSLAFNQTKITSLVLPKNFTELFTAANIGHAHFSNPVDLYFTGNYVQDLQHGIDSLPAGSNIYYLPTTTGWDSISGAKSYDLKVEIIGGSSTTTDLLALKEGDIIDITANSAQANKTFVRWVSSNGGTFADENSAETNFTVPSENTTITAVFKSIPSVKFSDTAIEIPADNSPVSIEDLAPTITGGSATVTWYNSDDTPLLEAPTNAGTYKIGVSLLENDEYAPLAEVKKEFSIVKTGQSINITTNNMAIPYDTAPVSVEDFAGTYSITGDGTATFKWYIPDGTEISAPTNTGSYKLGISLSETNANLAHSEVIIDFSISKAVSSIVFDAASVNVPYDGSEVQPYHDFKFTATGDSGSLKSSWYTTQNPNTAIHTPVNAGTYILELFFDEGENYTASQKIRKEFTISPLNLTANVNITPTSFKAGDVLTANVNNLSVSGVNLKYQWQLNGENISGATNSTYTLPSSYSYGEITVVVSSNDVNYTGSFVSQPVGEKEASVTPAYYITSGSNQTSPKNSSLVFQTDIYFKNFAGIWIDGVSQDVSSIATLTEGDVKVTLKSSYLNTLSLGEHLITFVATDGGMASTYFTLTAAVVTPVATPNPTVAPTTAPTPTPAPTPTITSQPAPEAPAPEDTSSQADNSGLPIIPIAIGIVVAVIGIGFIIKKRSADN